ncbi:Cytochrome P450 4V2, partial [Stegodyphus mimosarum]
MFAFINLSTSSNGKWWRDRRKVLQPAFHSKAVKTHIPIYNEHSYILVDKLKKRINEPWIDAEYVLTACSMDIMFRTTTGTSIGTQDGAADAVLLEPVKEVPELLIHRLIRPWLWYNPIYKLTSSGRKFRKC